MPFGLWFFCVALTASKAQPFYSKKRSPNICFSDLSVVGQFRYEIEKTKYSINKHIINIRNIRMYICVIYLFLHVLVAPCIEWRDRALIVRVSRACPSSTGVSMRVKSHHDAIAVLDSTVVCVCVISVSACVHCVVAFNPTDRTNSIYIFTYPCACAFWVQRTPIA